MRLWLPVPGPFRFLTMVTGKRLADFGYRAFTGSMMLLTVYGGYLCVMRGYRFAQKQNQLKLAAENQDPETLKDWCPTDWSPLCTDVDIHPPPPPPPPIPPLYLSIAKITKIIILIGMIADLNVRVLCPRKEDVLFMKMIQQH